MQPVLIFRFTQTEGPGYLGDFLSAKGVPQSQINVDLGDTIPSDISGYSGLVLMGGPMSVNDPLPWIEPVLKVARDAVKQAVPVLGHCLGGQLLSKALGGLITRSPVKEIGWGKVSKVDETQVTDWLGSLPREFEVFQWHGETFTLPPGARHLLRSAYCENQAYLIDNRHLGLQCHVEMTEAMIRAWCEVGSAEIAGARSSPAVQLPEIIQENLAVRIAQLNQVADVLYGRWAQGLVSI
jgi:GMP synthase-like glutamine amidotransferase